MRLDPGSCRGQRDRGGLYSNPNKRPICLNFCYISEPPTHRSQQLQAQLPTFLTSFAKGSLVETSLVQTSPVPPNTTRTRAQQEKQPPDLHPHSRNVSEPSESPRPSSPAPARRPNMRHVHRCRPWDPPPRASVLVGPTPAREAAGPMSKRVHRSRGKRGRQSCFSALVKSGEGCSEVIWRIIGRFRFSIPNSWGKGCVGCWLIWE